MTNGINKVLLIGNLGQEPELRHTAGGTAVTNLRLATNSSYTDPEGTLTEKTEWHTVVCWGKLAEICGQILRKGSLLYVEGRLQTRTWIDRDGAERTTTEVKAREMQLLAHPTSE